LSNRNILLLFFSEANLKELFWFYHFNKKMQKKVSFNFLFVVLFLATFVHKSYGQLVNITYSENPAVYTVGVEITPNVPTVGGGVDSVSWTVMPDLPNGLELNETSGVITGTPTEASDTTSYEIAAVLDDMQMGFVELNITVEGTDGSSRTGRALAIALPGGITLLIFAVGILFMLYNRNGNVSNIFVSSYYNYYSNEYNLPPRTSRNYNKPKRRNETEYDFEEL